MAQNLSIKLQVRISPEQEGKIRATCIEWSDKDTKFSPSDVVRALIDALGTVPEPKVVERNL